MSQSSRRVDPFLFIAFPGRSDMPKKVKRTIRIFAMRGDGLEQQLGVFAPAIAANLRMVDLRLRKAGLTELSGFLVADEDQWSDHQVAYDAFAAAGKYFQHHPESIPFSDILMKTFPGIVQALAKIPENSKVRLTLVEIGHDGLDHGSLVQFDQ
jgi:hypothetical protein